MFEVKIKIRQRKATVTMLDGMQDSIFYSGKIGPSFKPPKAAITEGRNLKA
jgi:hypothetical protein